MSPKRQSLAAVFAIPLLLAVFSLTGLIGALLADGEWDLAGAGLLATSLAAVGWARWRRSRDRA
jgi:hypothetical protein